jgi:predicted RNA-binding protein Jag
VEQLLTDILSHMGYPAHLEFKDASDGSLSVALHFDKGLPPGVEAGRRSQVVDSLQFLLNKMLHRPGMERRFVLVGAGHHPEPKSERLKREAAAAQAAAAQAAAAPAPAPAKAAPPPPPPAPVKVAAPPPPPAPAPAPARAASARRASEEEERTLAVSEDAALQQAARKLAEKSAALGRSYALVKMKPEDRARVLKAAEGVAGVKVTCEGEGRHRRVVFSPDKPAPLPRRSLLPVDDDEDMLDG